MARALDGSAEWQRLVAARRNLGRLYDRGCSNLTGGQRDLGLERMGRCARLAWDHGVEAYRSSSTPRPGVTTGHLLLGVLEEESCAGGLILARMQLDLKWACMVTEFVLLHSRHQSASDQEAVDWGGVPHTIAAANVLELAVEEANLFSSTYPIGTEHLLLALLRVPDGMGCRVLQYFGIEGDKARAARDELWELLRSPE